jgi:predicted RNA-binding Zn-ribbon protein involved in translation (DUF1610 family)
VLNTVGVGLLPVAQLARKEVRAVACGRRHTIALVSAEWIQDSEAEACMRCGVTFTFTIRKHHCRNCGGVFCGRCTSHKLALLHLGLVDRVRVCDSCYERLAPASGAGVTAGGGPALA